MGNRLADHPHLIEAAGSYFQLRADAVVVVLAAPRPEADELNLDVVVGVASVVAKQTHASVRARHEDVEVTVATVVGDGDVPAGADVLRQPGGHVVEPPGSGISEEQQAASTRLCRLPNYEQVLPPVVVEVEEGCIQADHLLQRLVHRSGAAIRLERPIAVVHVQGVLALPEPGDEQVEEPIVVVVGHGNGTRTAIGLHPAG